jgi:hypothetical protein
MEPRTYAITFKGEAGRAVRTAFDGVTISVHKGYTTIQPDVQDQAALFGVLDRINSLGLELLEVRLVSRPPSQSRPD